VASFQFATKDVEVSALVMTELHGWCCRLPLKSGGRRRARQGGDGDSTADSRRRSSLVAPRLLSRAVPARPVERHHEASPGAITHQAAAPGHRAERDQPGEGPRDEHVLELSTADTVGGGERSTAGRRSRGVAARVRQDERAERQGCSGRRKDD